MAVRVILFVLALAAVGYGEVANFKTCPEVSSEACTVTQVRVTPCRNPKLCRIIKGTSPTLDFDFIPNFTAGKLKTGVFWDSPSGDIAFPDIYRLDGCPYTTCPTEAGKQQTMNFSFRVSKKHPNGKFDFKWKVWNEDDESQVCCFTTKVELKK